MEPRQFAPGALPVALASPMTNCRASSVTSTHHAGKHHTAREILVTSERTTEDPLQRRDSWPASMPTLLHSVDSAERHEGSDVRQRQAAPYSERVIQSCPSLPQPFLHPLSESSAPPCWPNGPAPSDSSSNEEGGSTGAAAVVRPRGSSDMNETAERDAKLLDLGPELLVRVMMCLEDTASLAACRETCLALCAAATSCLGRQVCTPHALCRCLRCSHCRNTNCALLLRGLPGAMYLTRAPQLSRNITCACWGLMMVEGSQTCE